MFLIYLALSSWVSMWIFMGVVTRTAIIISVSQRRKLGLTEAKGYWKNEWQTLAHFRKLLFPRGQLVYRWSPNYICIILTSMPLCTGWCRRDLFEDWGIELEAHKDWWKPQVSISHEHVHNCFLSVSIQTDSLLSILKVN